MSFKSVFQPTALASLIAASLYSSAYAGIVRSDVDYQLFRDFAENKGAFKVGASNIPVYDNNNVFLGWVMKDIPMPDLRVANRGSAVATLFAPQYIMSVQHNIGYENVQFGAEINNHLDLKHFTYMLVDRNDYQGTEFRHHDYHIPRLHKLVTEVAPVEHSTLSNQTIFYTGNRERFPAFARLGSGTQKIRHADGTEKEVPIHRLYLIGGTNTLAISTRPHDRNTVTFHSETKDLYDKNAYSPLTNLMQPGDSGSPLFVYDKEQGKWLLIGVLNGNSDFGNWYTMPRLNFIKQQLQEDIAGTLSNTVTGQQFTWTPQGNTSHIQATGTHLNVPLKDNSLAVGQKDKPQLNHGKTVYFTGENGTLILNDNIDQGAGALHFGANFTVKGKNNKITWQGAGIIVDEGKTVDWQVLSPKDDRLSKLGKGTLLVNTDTRTTSGSLSVGEGEVVLAQRGRNKSPVFSEVHIVSGRPTVTLAPNYTRPENIYFGFRGGRLNLNGNNPVFERIKSIDEGARIVNHNRTASSTLYLTGETNKPLTGFGGHFGEEDSTRHNGILNVEYAPSTADSTFLFTGYANLNGHFTVGAGRAIISGKQPLHALDQHNSFKEIIKEDHWENRTFTATNVLVKDNAKLHITRNISKFNSNITATHNASVQLGYLPNSPICLRSDYTGTVTCENNKTLTNEIEANIPLTQAKGHIQLTDQSSFTLGKAHLIGTIANSYHSKLHLTDKAKWTLTDSSKLWHIHLDEGAEITLNDQFDTFTPSSTSTAFRRATNEVHRQSKGVSKFNKLQINGNLTGAGKFNFLTDAASGEHDQVIVNGFAVGDFLLSVKNSGNEPQNTEQLSLLKLNHGAQDEFTVNVTLENQQVDLGTYRYRLLNDSHDYRLHNPQKEQELEADKQRQQEQEKAEQQALRNELATAQLKLAEQTQALENAETRLQTNLRETEAIRQQLAELQRDTSQTELVAQLRQQLTEKEAEITQARSQIAHIQTEKQQAEQTAKQTQEQLSAQNTQLSTQLAEQQQRARNLANQLTVLEENLAEKNQALNMAQTQVTQIQSEVDDLRKQLNILKNENTQEAFITELERQLDEKRTELTQVKEQANQLAQQKQTAEEQVKHTSTQLREMQAQNADLSQQLAVAESARQAAEKAQRNLAAAVARLEQSQQEAQHQQAQTQQALAQANQALADKTKAVEQAQQQLAIATKEKQEADRLLAQAKQAEQQANTELAKHQQQLVEEQTLRQAAEQAKAHALVAEQKAKEAQHIAQVAQQAAEKAKQEAVQARLTAEETTRQQIAQATEKTLEANRLSKELEEALTAKQMLEQLLQDHTQPEQQLAQLRQERAAAEARANQAQQALASAQQHAKEAKQQAEQATKQAIETIAEKTLQLQTLQASLDTALAEKSRLTALATQAEQTAINANNALSDLRQRLEAEEAEHQQTRLAKATAEQALQALELAKQQLEQAIHDEQIAREIVEARAMQAEQSAEKLAKQVKQTHQELADAQAQLKIAQDRVAQAEKETKDNQIALDTLAKKAAQLESLQDSLTTALNEKKRLAELAEQAKLAEAEANQSLHGLRQRLEAEKSQHGQALLDKQAAEQALRLAQQQLADAKAQAEHTAENQATLLAEKVTQVEKAQSALAVAQQTLNDIATRLAKAEADKQRMEQALQDSQRARQQAEEKHQQAEQQVAAAEKQVNVVKSALEKLEQETTRPLQRELISRYANTALSEWSTQTNMLMQVNESLNRHLLTNHDGQGQVWANVNGINAQYLSDNHRRYAQKMTLTQLGLSTSMADDSNTQVGVVLSKNRSQTNFSDHHSAKSELNMASLFIKKAWENGLFATLNGGYGHSNTTLVSDEQSQQLKRQLWNLSANLGYRWNSPFIAVQPSVGISYAHISGVNYRLNNVDIQVNDLHFTTYHAGLGLSKTFAADKWSVTPRFSSHYVNAAQKQAQLRSNDIPLQQRAGRYLQNELGVAARVNQWEMDLHAGLITGNQIGKQKFAGLKVSYKW
ncbi:MAG: S6 family peptidase [Pasteurellaceae bacterium]|nr:S6 family peptidase [Pasteurellaceae bacterium]